MYYSVFFPSPQRKEKRKQGEGHLTLPAPSYGMAGPLPFQGSIWSVGPVWPQQSFPMAWVSVKAWVVSGSLDLVSVSSQLSLSLLRD